MSVKPPPPNVLPSNVRCFMRYGNSGGMYRICVDADGFKDGVKTPPQKLAPLQTPEQFIKGLKGKDSYGDLTKGQKTEYHRLDMANRRKAERELIAKGKEEVKRQKELDRAERKKARLQKAKAKLEAKAKKEKEKAEGKKVKVKKKKPSQPAQKTSVKSTGKKTIVSFG